MLDINELEEKFSNDQEEFGRRKEEIVLSKNQIETLRKLFMKQNLTIQDMEEIEYLLVGYEIKLSKLDDLERYRLAKFLIWIHEMITAAKRIRENIENEKNVENNETIVALLKENYKKITETFKKMVAVYLFLLRSPLSMSGFMVDILTKERSENISNDLLPQYKIGGVE